MSLISEADLSQKVLSQLDADELATMLDGLNAKAARVAPCLGWDGSQADQPAPSEGLLAEVKLILIGVVRRWAEAGSGAFSQKMATTGPYSSMETIDTRNRTGYNLWPSEIAQLQDLCKTGGTTQAFTIDTAPTSPYGGHAPWCSINFGATFCSCGFDIAGVPIYEMG